MPESAQPSVDVLLVEDSPTQAQLVSLIVGEIDDFNLVHVCVDGVDGMAYLRRENEYSNVKRPDVVLLDINMPRKNGFEVLQEMKADKDLRAIPVVMLTTSSEDEDIAKSYQDGASTYMSKPLELNKLKEVLAHFANYWSRAAKLPRDES